MPAKKTTPPAKAKAKTAAKVAVKAPAKKVAKPKAAPKPAAKPASSKKPAVKVKPAVAKKAPPVKKPATKAPAKVAPKAAAKGIAKKPVATKAVAKKTASKVVSKVASKAPSKPAAKAKSKTSSPSAKPATKAAVKTTPKKPVAVKPVAKAPVKVATKPVAKVAPKAAIPKPTVAPETEAKKPGRKRGNNKPIAPSMADAEVIPAHAPDAAKATFIQDNTPVMTVTVPAPIKKDPKRANNWKTKPVAELTDADMLAMPDSEYMNDVQIAFFRARLVALKNDMLANAGQTTENLREDTVVVPDPADRATIEEEHALELRTRDRERKLLKKIQQSIMAIDSGEYGFCDETGEPIGVGRLLARPTASLSLEAQQRRELKQKLYGD